MAHKKTMKKGGKKQTKWMKLVRSMLRHNKKTNKNYTLRQAMKDAKMVYKR